MPEEQHKLPSSRSLIRELNHLGEGRFSVGDLPRRVQALELAMRAPCTYKAGRVSTPLQKLTPWRRGDAGFSIQATETLRTC
jgi:hypothetical protein